MFRRSRTPSLLYVAVAVAALGLVACRHPGSAKLEGRWRGVRAEGVFATVEAQGQANGFAMTTEIIAKGDQILISTASNKNQQATYTVDAESEREVTIHTDRDGPTGKETFSFSDDGKSMTWKIDPTRGIVFQKIDTK